MKSIKFHWWHDANMDGCYFYRTSFGAKMPGDANYGPFDSFSAAKQDAIEFYRADVRIAQERMHRIRNLKKENAIIEEINEN